ncbi:hypothetical protein VFPFJ_01852 [Purpureocillium lilacinum]|uniref:Uncharacterized protein n=1 Tax=Purpureocillium lilacinum TaxID=33203 RepID=A0A179G177_PURLI|nr:hypothetical protein VFPFJ_01852 [Purpureocillium lilacinum]OAQ71624.1 hypothetical protein VFPBJ_10403 [Purpureocillium lilacinum]OAQ92691.1 hypothetical protein VFPFJ_01852 [Purpureocillium lilacinum]
MSADGRATPWLRSDLAAAGWNPQRGRATIQICFLHAAINPTAPGSASILPNVYLAGLTLAS